MTTIYGTSNNDTLTGASTDDYLYGYDGDDYLSGRGGWDLLEGGNGADTIVGTPYVYGGEGEDYASYRDSKVGVNVNLATGTGSGGTAEGDVIIDIFGVIGSRYGDTITGNTNVNLLTGKSGDDILISGGGNGRDILDGGRGADTIIGGSGADSFTYDNPDTDSNSSSTDLIKNFTQGEDYFFLYYTTYYDISSFTITKSDGYTIVQSNKEDFVFKMEGEYNLTNDDFYFSEKPIGLNPNLVAASDFADANAIMYGTSWTGTAGKNVNITYTFNTGNAYYGTNIEGLDSFEKSMVYSALQSINDIANVTFTETSSANAEITFYTSQTNNTGVAWSREYGTKQFKDVQIELRNTLIHDKGQEFSDYIYIHEIGHSLGLQHSKEGGFTLSKNIDNVAYTVMSYGIYSKQSDVSYYADNLPDSPMFLDIVALQHLYGANTSYNSGATSYNFSGSKSAETIWDGGGTDVIDGSSASGNNTIDLREGFDYMTSIGEGRIWIAQNANIENAKGGSNNDKIIGNDLNNNLQGNDGNDTLTGGVGHDELLGGRNDDYLNGNQGNDILNGNQGNDILNGNKGDDQVYGGKGDDQVYGGKDDDNVYGGQAQDIVNGNKGDDNVYGDKGNDIVHGGQGNDNIYGGSGNDLIFGDKGSDNLYGNDGADIFIFNVADTNIGSDIILDFEQGIDQIQLDNNTLTAQQIINNTTFTNGNAYMNLGLENTLTIVGITEFFTNDFVI